MLFYLLIHFRYLLIIHIRIFTITVLFNLAFCLVGRSVGRSAKSSSHQVITSSSHSFSRIPCIYDVPMFVDGYTHGDCSDGCRDSEAECQEGKCKCKAGFVDINGKCSSGKVASIS